MQSIPPTLDEIWDFRIYREVHDFNGVLSMCKTHWAFFYILLFDDEFSTFINCLSKVPLEEYQYGFLAVEALKKHKHHHAYALLYHIEKPNLLKVLSQHYDIFVKNIVRRRGRFTVDVMRHKLYLHVNLFTLLIECGLKVKSSDLWLLTVKHYGYFALVACLLYKNNSVFHIYEDEHLIYIPNSLIYNTTLDQFILLFQLKHLPQIDNRLRELLYHEISTSWGLEPEKLEEAVRHKYVNSEIKYNFIDELDEVKKIQWAPLEIVDIIASYVCVCYRKRKKLCFLPNLISFVDYRQQKR